MIRTSLLAALAIALTSNLHAQTPFHQGKTVRLIIGTTAGSNYDMYGRLVAQYFGKHIPGNPEVVVQNMPGGGNIVAANYLYAVAKPDGLTVGSINPALYFNQLGGHKEVQFDWSKFIYIGSPDRSEDLCTCGPMRRSKASTTSEMPHKAPSAAPPAPAQRVTICRRF